MNWNPRLIANLSCVCKWFDEVAKQVLWKEFCHARAPKMMLDLHSDGSHIVDGNWKALGKLLIYCNGCTKGGLFGNVHVQGAFRLWLSLLQNSTDQACVCVCAFSCPNNNSWYQSLLVFDPRLCSRAVFDPRRR